MFRSLALLHALASMLLLWSCTTEGPGGAGNDSPGESADAGTSAAVDAGGADSDAGDGSVPDSGSSNREDAGTMADAGPQSTDGGMASTPIETDCPMPPDNNTICMTGEGLGTQIFIYPNAASTLTGNTDDGDASLQDNTTLNFPIDATRQYDCGIPDGSAEKPLIAINLGVNIYAGDETSSAWVVSNFPDGAVCDVEVTQGAPASGDVYQGRFSATLIRAISITETDPSQTLRIAGTFHGTRP